MIAELFTALYMGIELPEQLYNWYIDHGGQSFMTHQSFILMYLLMHLSKMKCFFSNTQG